MFNALNRQPKNALNLLPWRAAQQRRALHLLGWQTFFSILLGSVIWIGCASWQDELSQKTFLKRTALSSAQQALTQTEQQIQQFRAHYQQQEQQPSLDSALVLQIFQQLRSLPLQRGELTELQLSSSQLILRGKSENQQEFNALHQFLENQSQFRQISLSEFKPQAEQILFQFELQLENQ